ncbi:MAG: peptidylprolyl isomerase [Maricaulaceae bacterium]
MTETAEAPQTLIMTLDGGEVHIKLRADLAPQHAARITELAEQGYYDGLTFHRVIDGFVAQGGCPKGNGTGGSGQKIPAEFSEEPHVRGVCSMARTNDPNSADSQFFICLDAVPYLDNKYTVWGEVTSGMEHVDALPKGEPPAEPGKIVSFRSAAA